MTALRARWHNVLSGFWFLPTTVVVALAVLALLAVRIDRGLATDGIGLLFSGDASAARGILSTIAGATATIAGVVFSITIVTLQLVSSQFTPRALRGFLKDRMNQLAAGVFVGTFVYCLLVLRTVRSSGPAGADGEFVPAFAVTTGTLLGLTSLLVLVAFVHHVASSIQASAIAERIGRETMDAVERLYPEPYGEGEDDADGERIATSWGESESPVVVRPDRPGYVQSIALDDLARELESPDVRLHVRVRPGDFVTPRDVLVAAWDVALEPEEARRKVARAINVAGERDTRDDVAFGLRQLSDVAVRALSPGVNDPTTALTCVGYVRPALEQLAGRKAPSVVRRFGDACAVVEHRTFADHLAEAFLEVGRHARDEIRVAHAVLAALGSIAEAAIEARAWGRVADVVELAERIGAHALEDVPSAQDRELLEDALDSVRALRRRVAPTG